MIYLADYYFVKILSFQLFIFHVSHSADQAFELSFVLVGYLVLGSLGDCLSLSQN
jgi:hypothetical protein